jgi:hypothetical protein
MQTELKILGAVAVLLGVMTLRAVAEDRSDMAALVGCWDFDRSLEERAGSVPDTLTPHGGQPRFVDACTHAGSTSTVIRSASTICGP